jgi:putative FmdB family regulatory protein
MPIYEYLCSKCGHQFEALVRAGKAAPACEKCGAAELERQMSLPSVKSDTTRGQAMRAARARDKKQGWERVNEQRNYERDHD